MAWVYLGFIALDMYALVFVMTPSQGGPAHRTGGSPCSSSGSPQYSIRSRRVIRSWRAASRIVKMASATPIAQA
ncbi:hypothetical protein BSA16_26510 [Micromonospora sp. Rc5]|nr:hypothetical protein BSA16_26510 [Micromonospora sp. Rc5]